MNDYPTELDLHGERMTLEEAVLRGLIAIKEDGEIVRLTGDECAPVRPDFTEINDGDYTGTVVSNNNENS